MSHSPTSEQAAETEPAPHRRNFFAMATQAIGGVVALALAIPGVRYLLDPLGRRTQVDEFRPLPISLNELVPEVPRQVTIIETRTDAWVRYPAEPIGSVWLVRQPEGTSPAVLAFTSECPHLGCAINLAGDGSGFFCPCHASTFKLDGERTNEIPPRAMDRLEVDPASLTDPAAPIRIKFQRFRTGTEEKTPLV